MKNPVLLAMSILAAAQLITNASGLTDVVPAKWVMLGSVVVAAAQFGIQYWVRGVVTPLVAPKDAEGVPLVRAGYRADL
jgi:hypothetical protein